MSYNSSALQTLRAAIDREFELTGMSGAPVADPALLGDALMFLDSLDSLVNPGATMTEDQAFALSDFIVDHWLPKEPDYLHLMGHRITMATFINSCSA